jgi:hypothetical protein
MKGSDWSSLNAHRYLAGQPLFEADRIKTLQLHTTSADSNKDKDEYDIFFVTDFLRSLKFSDVEIKNLIDGVKSAVGVIGGIFSAVGAVTSAIDLMKKLGIFGPQVDPIKEELDAIKGRVNQLYFHEKFKDWAALRNNAHSGETDHSFRLMPIT